PPVAHVAVGLVRIEQEDVRVERAAVHAAQLGQRGKAGHPGPGALGGRRCARPAVGRSRTRPVRVTAAAGLMETSGRLLRVPRNGTHPRFTSTTSPPGRTSGVNTW